MWYLIVRLIDRETRERETGKGGSILVPEIKYSDLIVSWMDGETEEGD